MWLISMLLQVMHMATTAVYVYTSYGEIAVVWLSYKIAIVWCPKSIKLDMIMMI